MTTKRPSSTATRKMASSTRKTQGGQQRQQEKVHVVDPFRQFFLGSIQSLIESEEHNPPNEQSLLTLLQTVSPQLTSLDHVLDIHHPGDFNNNDEESLDSDSSDGSNIEKMKSLAEPTDRAMKAFKTLKLRIHPDKHPQEFSRATLVFQNVQLFWDQAIQVAISAQCAAICRHRRRGNNHDNYKEKDQMTKTGGGGENSSMDMDATTTLANSNKRKRKEKASRSQSSTVSNNHTTTDDESDMDSDFDSNPGANATSDHNMNDASYNGSEEDEVESNVPYTSTNDDEEEEEKEYPHKRSKHAKTSKRQKRSHSNNTPYKQPPRRRPTNNHHNNNNNLIQYPVEFQCQMQWSHMDLVRLHPLPPPPPSMTLLKSSRHEIDNNKNNNGSSNNTTAADNDDIMTQYVNGINLPIVLAYKCLNARGSIAHGRRITKSYQWKDVVLLQQQQQQQQNNNQSQQSTCPQEVIANVFQSAIGCDKMKELTSIEDIKEEIRVYGPVISVSFHLSEAYLQMTESASTTTSSSNATMMNSNMEDNDDEDDDVASTQYSLSKGGGFVKDLVGDIHPLLIVGWKLTPYGEMWIVQPIGNHGQYGHEERDNHGDIQQTQSQTYIGFGQFAIDELCVAPFRSFLDHMTWQSPGPYFDSDFTDAPRWREWKEMDLPLNETEFQTLATCGCFEKGIIRAATLAASAMEENENGGQDGNGDANLFVIRDLEKKAHSASYRLKEIRWQSSTLEWIVTVVSVPSTT